MTSLFLLGLFAVVSIGWSLVSIRIWGCLQYAIASVLTAKIAGSRVAPKSPGYGSRAFNVGDDGKDGRLQLQNELSEEPSIESSGWGLLHVSIYCGLGLLTAIWMSLHHGNSVCSSLGFLPASYSCHVRPTAWLDVHLCRAAMMFFSLSSLLCREESEEATLEIMMLSSLSDILMFVVVLGFVGHFARHLDKTIHRPYGQRWQYFRNGLLTAFLSPVLRYVFELVEAMFGWLKHHAISLAAYPGLPTNLASLSGPCTMTAQSEGLLHSAKST